MRKKFHLSEGDYLQVEEVKQGILLKPVAVIEKKLAEKESKERDLMLQSAEDRYYKFLKEKKDLVKRLPQNQIALYLGINPSTLSRLKRKETGMTDELSAVSL